MSVRRFDGLELFLGLSLGITICTGCGRNVNSDAPSTEDGLTISAPAPAWEDQIGLVRSGDSTAVRCTDAPVTGEQWAMLSEGCASLTTLEADIQMLSAEDLDLWQSLPGLERLKLLGPVDDTALERIARQPAIRFINLPTGSFTDSGLVSLGQLPDLVQLRFRSPHVSDDGLQAIGQMKTLRFLHLIDVPITDAGLVHLHGMTQLESFYLDGGRCTDDGLRELLRSLPGLHFHRDQLHLPGDPHADDHSTDGPTASESSASTLPHD